jgi:hypothetical protein
LWDGWSWWCSGSGGGSSQGCGAGKITVMCGTLNGRTYLATDTAWGTGTFCGGGYSIPASPAFPAQGGSTGWQCTDAMGSQAWCVAYRALPVVYTCTGTPPQDALRCSGDDTGLTANTAWQQVTSCTDATKCEYMMPSYSCTGGNPPQGAMWCAGDDTGLTANTAWQQVASCTDATKCEYIMPSYSCTGGNPPQGAIWCTDDNAGLTADTAWQQVTSCTDVRKCEYTMPSCGPDNGVLVNNRPTDPGLCSADSTSSEVTFDARGNWHWTCTHTSVESGSLAVNCEAPSCLTTMPVDLQPYVYFNSDGNPNNAVATVTCPNVCCAIDSSNGAITVCNSDPAAGLIPVFPGSRSYPAECWFDNDHNRTNDSNEPKISYHPGRTISTMCTARSCRSQGECQALPQAANTAQACKSTCNSDADCSKGRMIETRP